MTTTAAPIALPLIGHTLALTSALLLSFDSGRTRHGEAALQDALRLDTARGSYIGIPSIWVGYGEALED